MTTLYNKNIDLLTHRWPDISAAIRESVAPTDYQVIQGAKEISVRINDIDLASRYDRKNEAELQAENLRSDTEEAWCYGIALGDLPITLLQRDKLKTLHVVILNCGILQLTMQLVDHSLWLADKRVVLHLGESLLDIQSPFTVVPACLHLISDSVVRLRDFITLELNTPFLQQKFEYRKDELTQRVVDNRNIIAGDDDIKALFSTKKLETILLAGAGPTLDTTFTILAKYNAKFTLIAVDAALKPLMNNNIVPDIVVSIDDNRNNILSYFDFDLSPLRDSKLVYYPIVHNDVLLRWPGKRFCAYGVNAFYEEIDIAMIRSKLFSSGSVFHAAVDLAVQMKSNRIIMFGADFAFPRGKHYVSGINRQVKKDETNIGKSWLYNGFSEKIETQANLTGYLRDLERYIKRHSEVSFVNSSKDGAFIEGTTYLDQISTL